MQIIGHRGARGLAPENTPQGIKHALDLGVVDWIEFDVHRTKDGHVVVLHDRTTRRIATKTVRVHQANLATLQTLEMKDDFSIAELKDVVAVIGKRAKINIELKSKGCGEIVTKLIEELVQKGYTYDHFLVSSFFPPLLYDIQRRNKHIPLGFLQVAGLSSSFAPLLRTLSLRAIGFEHHKISTKAVALAKRHGLFTYAYTINDPHEAQMLQAKGIDAIVTDYPDVIHQQLHSK